MFSDFSALFVKACVLLGGAEWKAKIARCVRYSYPGILPLKNRGQLHIPHSQHKIDVQHR